MTSQQPLKSEAYQSWRFLTINYQRCVGCGCCERACAMAHGNIVGPLQSMIGVIKLAHQELPFPVVCQQCLDPPCAAVCPTRALKRNSETGAVVVDFQLCIGCGMCSSICPFGGIFLDLELGHAVKCDLCEGNPRCVEACSYGAIQAVTAGEEVMMSRKKAIEWTSAVGINIAVSG